MKKNSSPNEVWLPSNISSNKSYSAYLLQNNFRFDYICKRKVGDFVPDSNYQQTRSRIWRYEGHLTFGVCLIGKLCGIDQRDGVLYFRLYLSERPYPCKTKQPVLLNSFCCSPALHGQLSRLVWAGEPWRTGSWNQLFICPGMQKTRLSLTLFRWGGRQTTNFAQSASRDYQAQVLYPSVHSLLFCRSYTDVRRNTLLTQRLGLWPLVAR